MKSKDNLWSQLKKIVPEYLQDNLSEGGSDIVSLIKEVYDKEAVLLPDIEETEELFKDLALVVDILDACIAAMDLKVDAKIYKSHKQQRQESLARAKMLINRLEA